VGGQISPRLIKRAASAAIMIPLSLLLMATKTGFLALVTFAFVLCLFEWAGMVRAAPRRKVQIALVGLIYLPVCFLSFIALRFMPDGLFIVIALLVSVWLSDTGAYVIGKSVGGPKWVPSISPNKTWAGVGGAMLFPAAAFLIFWAVCGILFSVPDRVTSGMLMAVGHDPVVSYISPFMVILGALLFAILGFVCQIGDLFISVFKRRAGVKDTGNLIPGHGGLLDRIDALMLAAVFVFVFFRLLG